MKFQLNTWNNIQENWLWKCYVSCGIECIYNVILLTGIILLQVCLASACIHAKFYSWRLLCKFALPDIVVWCTGAKKLITIELTCSTVGIKTRRGLWEEGSHVFRAHRAMTSTGVTLCGFSQSKSAYVTSVHTDGRSRDIWHEQTQGDSETEPSCRACVKLVVATKRGSRRVRSEQLSHLKHGWTTSSLEYMDERPEIPTKSWVHADDDSCSI